MKIVKLLILFVAATQSPSRAADRIEIIPDVVYGHKSGMALTFDVLQPKAEANGAGVLFMVSGGWVSRWSNPQVRWDRSVQTHGTYHRLVERGFTVFLVRHGSSPRFKVPEAVEDVRRAVRFIRLHADRYSLDADRLGVFGGSAGGHLSLMLGTQWDKGKSDSTDPVEKSSSQVAAVVAYFPPVDLRQSVGPSDRFPALDFDPALAESVSPLLHVSSDDPPALLIHGDQDRLVRIHNSERIYKAFQEADVTTKFITLKGAGHGFRGEDRKRATQAMVDWFTKHLSE